jgi:hypothetical protein
MSRASRTTALARTRAHNLEPPGSAESEISVGIGRRIARNRDQLRAFESCGAEQMAAPRQFAEIDRPGRNVKQRAEHGNPRRLVAPGPGGDVQAGRLPRAGRVTILATVKLHDVDPTAYWVAAIEAVERGEALVPWRFAARR